MLIVIVVGLHFISFVSPMYSPETYKKEKKIAKKHTLPLLFVLYEKYNSIYVFRRGVLFLALLF